MNQHEENRREINDLVEEVQKNEEELKDGIHLALITRRLVKTQVTENDVDDQRDNLFNQALIKFDCGVTLFRTRFPNLASRSSIIRGNLILVLSLSDPNFV